MGPFAGKVLWITMTPGRVDAIMLSIADPLVGEHHILFSMDVGSRISIDGHEHYNGITPGYLFDWFAQAPEAIVTVHPDPQRYGLSTLTEFRSAP